MAEGEVSRPAQMKPEELPRVFQCNLSRLLDRVIEPGLAVHPIHPELLSGPAPSYGDFLDRCAAMVDNHMANEAAKAYALTLAAVFERQLHLYVRQLWDSGRLAAPTSKPTRQRPDYETLLADASSHASVDRAALGLAQPLAELLLVGNVVRHGGGLSCKKLKVFAPRLWAYNPSRYVDLSPGPPSDSETMLILADDLRFYAVAAMIFWGHADKQPMATTRVPGYDFAGLAAKAAPADNAPIAKRAGT